MFAFATIQHFIATNHNKTVNNPTLFFQSMEKNISDILDCLGQIESKLRIANHHLQEAKEMILKMEEK